MVDVPNVFAAGGTVVAADVNENFDTLEAALSNIRSSALASDAGITSGQIADRYAIYHDNFMVVPPTSNGNLPGAAGAAAEYECPNSTSGEVIARHRLTLKTGQEAFICEVEFYVADVTQDTDWPVLGAQVGGTTLGGALVTVNSDDAYWRVRNTNPLDNPLVSVADGAIITILAGRSGTTGTPSIAGVWCRIVYKVRITS